MISQIKREDEEASNKRKLLYDGHGTGEDKRLVNLTKNISKLYLVQHSEDKFYELHNQIGKDLNAAVGQAERQLKISERCDRELAEVHRTIEEQEQQISQAVAELQNLRLELEYVDKLKKMDIYPDCHTTEEKILEAKQRKEKLSHRVRKCRDNIVTILEACRELRKVLDDEPESDSL